jgi:SET domain-containing protein
VRGHGNLRGEPVFLIGGARFRFSLPPAKRKQSRMAEKKLKVARKRSKIHGNGVFAIAPIRKGERIIQYVGKLITHEEADETYHGDVDSGHTFLFTLNKHWVIDANQGGSAARWINTSCDVNAVAYVHSERKKKPDPAKDTVWIEAKRAIKAGEEITYDYGFDFEVPYTAKLLRTWACKCGSPKCRKTMLKGKKVREAMRKYPNWSKGL